MLKDENEPVQKIALLNLLASKYSNSDSTKTFQYARKAIKIADQNNDAIGSIDAYFHIAWAHMRKRSYERSQEIFQLVIDRSREVGYKEGMADGLNGLSSVAFEIGDYRLAKETGVQALEICKQANYLTGMAHSYNNIGIIELQTGYPDKGLELFAMASNLDIELDDYIRLMLANRKGIVYANQGNLNLAIDEFFTTLDIEKKNENLKGISGSYNNIGVLFYQLRDYPKALKYYKEGFKVFQSINDEYGVATYYNNIAIVYLETGKYELARKNFKKSIEIGERVAFKRLLGWSYDGMSKVMQETGEYENGLAWATKALKVRKSLGKNRSLAQTYNTLGNNYNLLGQYDNAINNYENAAEIAIQIRNPLNQRDALQGLSECYASIGNYPEAYRYRLLYQELNDSLINNENLQRMSRLEAEYEFRQEKDSLEFAQKMDRIGYEMDLQQKSRIQKNTYIGLSIIFILLIVSLYLFYKTYRSNQMIRSQHNDLQRLNRAKTRFFSIISHDLRNPLNQLMGFSDIIWRRLEENLSPEQTEELEEMYKNQQAAAKRILDLLDGLINWALKEEGMVPYEPELLKIRDCVDLSLELHTIHANNKNISIDTNIDQSVQAWADRNAVMAILRNIIGNALKFTDQGGEIKISASQQNGSAKILISDTGVGIPAGDISKLFDFKDNYVRKGTSGESGSGLGLNLVYDLIQINRGNIEVESKPGKGTTFTVSLPSTKTS